jgi:hypothetical protein
MSPWAHAVLASWDTALPWTTYTYPCAPALRQIPAVPIALSVAVRCCKSTPK